MAEQMSRHDTICIEGTEISVDGAAAELSEILFSVAKSSLNRCKVYKKDSPKNKK
jgi:hypothetical protein